MATNKALNLAKDRSEAPLCHAITCIRWVPLSRVRGIHTPLCGLPLSVAIDLREITGDSSESCK